MSAQLGHGHMTLYRFLLLPVLLCMALGLSPRQAWADGVSIELNKLQPSDKGCRIYMVFMNATAGAISSYKPDLVFFDRAGVIADRLVVEGGPLAAGKTRVKLFDVANLACKDIARVLLNDIHTCEGPDKNAADCLSLTSTASLGSVEFIK